MRYHRGNDAWGRGSYKIPQYAVVGSSDCGSRSDSPAPTAAVGEELNDFRKVLAAEGIRSRTKYTRSGNVFMVKKWVVVSQADFIRAAKIALGYLAQHKDDTRYIHDADLEDVA